ncbi:MAG: OmpH family outer membrane protein [Pseudomonadota bacterium]
MKNSNLAIIGAAALAVAGLFAGSLITSAEAQKGGKSPVILTVSMDTVVAQSKAGKTIPAQAQDVQKSVSAELEAEAQKLQKDIESFEKNSELMSEEVRQKTAQELQVRYQRGLPQRAQIAEQAFRIAVQNAQSKILAESEPVLNDIIEKRGATVILDTSQVLYAAKETDVTQDVIKALDKKIDKVEVQKVSLAEIEKQLREAQAKAIAQQQEAGKKK